jgi:hypothetical protein
MFVNGPFNIHPHNIGYIQRFIVASAWGASIFLQPDEKAIYLSLALHKVFSCPL